MNLQIRYLHLNEYTNGIQGLNYDDQEWCLDRKSDLSILQQVYYGPDDNGSKGLTLKSWGNGYHNPYYLLTVF